MKTRIKVSCAGHYVPQVKTLFGWRPIWKNIQGFTQVFQSANEKYCIVFSEKEAMSIIDRHISPPKVTYIDYP